MIRRLSELGDFMRFYIYNKTRFCKKPGFVLFNPESYIQYPAPSNAQRASLQPGGRSPFPEQVFTGCVFGDMLFQLTAPQGLKGSAAAV